VVVVVVDVWDVMRWDGRANLGRSRSDEQSWKSRLVQEGNLR